MASHGGQRVTEGRLRFAVPRIACNRQARMTAQWHGQQRHNGKQRQQARCGARNGPVRPPMLGLNAQVSARFLKGDLDLPALREPADDLQWVLCEGRCITGPAYRSAPAGRAAAPSGSAQRAARCDATPPCRCTARSHTTLCRTSVAPLRIARPCLIQSAHRTGSAGECPFCGAARWRLACAAAPVHREVAPRSWTVVCRL